MSQPSSNEKQATETALPTIDKFIAHHTTQTDLAVKDPVCVICQEGFVRDLDMKELLYIDACKHEFHQKCLEGWIYSTQNKRNTCPACRVPLFKLNVLSPEQVAQARAEEEQEDGHMLGFDTQLYT